MLTVSQTCSPAGGATPCREAFYLRFPSLFHTGHSLIFPCDAKGQVPLDSLSEKSRNNYFFARAVVGRDFAWPVVEPALH